MQTQSVMWKCPEPISNIFSLPRATPVLVPPCPMPACCHQKVTPPAPCGPQPSPLLTIACASSREKCLFSLMCYCSPDRHCTHTCTHTLTHSHAHSLSATHTKPLPKPMGEHSISPHRFAPKTPPLSLCFQQPSTDEITAGIKRHRNQGYSHLAVIDFLPPLLTSPLPSG